MEQEDGRAMLRCVCLVMEDGGCVAEDGRFMLLRVDDAWGTGMLVGGRRMEDVGSKQMLDRR